MGKILHSLRFQLPAVVLGVFLGILFLLMLFFHEMTILLVKTRQLAQSAETSDFVAHWMTGLSSSARERTKLMSLGKESYLRSMQVDLNEISDLYRSMPGYGDTSAQSLRELRLLHDRHTEYMGRLDRFARDQVARRLQAARASAGAGGPAVFSVQARAESPAPKAGKGSKAAKGRKGSKAAQARMARAKPAARAQRAPVVDPGREIDLDTVSNEVFKAYENGLREGLLGVQEVMREERKDKLQSLQNSVDRAKDRLIYSLLLLLAMVAYVAVILKWKILDPMHLLKEGATEIGRGRLGFQVNVTSRNEIGELASVFNRMSSQLDAKQSAEVRLKRLEAIEQVVRSVNHEINNPLMIISANAEFLIAVWEQADEGTRQKLETIIGEVRRIFTVTQRLKEIKEPITEAYIGGETDQMIDIIRSSQVRKKDW